MASTVVRALAPMLLALAAVLVGPPPAGAADKLRPGILGERDRREAIEPTAWPWSSIGRVNRAGGGFCTGTLIGARRVLTAAHCFYDRRTKRWIRPDEVHFVAGYERGNYAFHGVARELVLPDPVPAFAGPTRLQPDDWAVVVLREAPKLRPIPLAPLEADRARRELAGKALIRAGYGRDRPHLLSMHSGCGLKAAQPTPGFVLHDCDSAPGDSGSPLLVTDGADARVVGLHIGVAGPSDRRFGVAVAAARFADAAADASGAR